MKTLKHGYKFTNKRNTKGGISSICVGVVSFVLFVAGIFLSYKKSGSAGIAVGMCGALSFVLSAIGFIIGLLSFKEKEKFYRCSYIGSIINGIMWIGMCIIIAWGMI